MMDPRLYTRQERDAASATADGSRNLVARIAELRLACQLEAEGHAARHAEASRTFGHGWRIDLPRQTMARLPIFRTARDSADLVRAGRAPVTSGRDPCPRCGTRGDLGCSHQSPAEWPGAGAQ